MARQYVRSDQKLFLMLSIKLTIKMKSFGSEMARWRKISSRWNQLQDGGRAGDATNAFFMLISDARLKK